MKGFPTKLTPSNIQQFSSYRYNRQLCYTRNHIYESMTKESFGKMELGIPNYGINLQNINMGLYDSGYKIDNNIIIKISDELKNLGWEVESCYGDTMLFVYPYGEKPTNAVNSICF
jgi:hypothetical protein